LGYATDFFEKKLSGWWAGRWQLEVLTDGEWRWKRVEAPGRRRSFSGRGVAHVTARQNLQLLKRKSWRERWVAWNL